MENEFGEVPIDDALIGGSRQPHHHLEQRLYLLANPTNWRTRCWICWTAPDSGQLAFDRLIIECTGMKPPIPARYSIGLFFSHEILRALLLDGIDHPGDRGARRPTAEPVQHRPGAGYADRLLLTKTDVAPDRKRADAAAAADERPRAGLPGTARRYRSDGLLSTSKALR
ncbi:hypothetical protein M8494_25225 [Serratia ureilytica]